MLQHQQKSWLSRILADAELEKKAPGIAIRIQKMIAAKQVAYVLGQMNYQLLAEKLRTFAEEIRSKESIRGEYARRVKVKVEAKERELMPIYSAKYVADVTAQLEKSGLLQEAFVFSQSIKFEENDRERLEAELLAKQKPAIVKEYQIKSWFKRNWKTQEHKHVNRETGEEVISYSLGDHVTKSVSSNHGGWRFWRGFWLNMQHSAKNITHDIIVKNLWNGPIGLRALLAEESFYTDWDVDAEGKRVPVSLRKPLSVVLDENHQRAEEAIKRFDSNEYHGVLPKKIARIWEVLFVRRFLQQGVYVFGRSMGQYLLTVGNTVVSGTAGAFTFFGSPIVALGDNLIYRPFIYNDEASSATSANIQGYFPAYKILANDMLYYGAGQATLAGSGIVLGSAVGAGMGLIGAVDIPTARIADIAVVKIFKGLGLSFPRESDSFARHVSGPGISGTGILFGIDTSIALSAIGLKVEEEILNDYGFQIKDVIRLPEVSLNDFESVFGTIARKPVVDAEILDNQNEIEENLGKSVEDKKRKLREMLYLPYNYEDHIVLSEADRDELWVKGAAFLENQLTAGVFSNWSEFEVDQFWLKKGLTRNSWVELTKYYLAEVFGENINTTLSEIEDRIRLVPDNQLVDVIASIFSQVPDEIIGRYKLIIQDRRRMAEQNKLPGPVLDYQLDENFFQELNSGSGLLMEENK